jgi:hypothetical protein
MGNHEVSHVGGSRRACTCRRPLNEFKMARLLGRDIVSVGHPSFQRIRKRLTEGRAVHPQRLQYVLFNIALVGLTRNTLNDVSG